MGKFLDASQPFGLCPPVFILLPSPFLAGKLKSHILWQAIEIAHIFKRAVETAHILKRAVETAHILGRAIKIAR